MATEKKMEKEKRQVSLLTSKVEAKEKIETQIKEGEDILDKEISNENQLEAARFARNEWYDFTKELLLSIFDGDEISKEFSASSSGGLTVTPGFAYKAKYFREFLKNKTAKLRSIVRRLELFPEKDINTSGEDLTQKEISNAIFIVHGHDNGIKQSVARLTEKLNLQPIILNEKENQGQTIVEKFEKHSNVGFAVVLLTADDMGGKKDSSQKPRARQNVILELGYFIGKLGRKRVCVLYFDGVELPSDLAGVLYVKLDEGESWKYQLAKEIKAAGIRIDLNKI